MFDEYIDNLKNDIVRETCNLINIPSVSIETPNPDMPFGEGAKNALDYALDLGNRLGFRTKNIDISNLEKGKIFLELLVT